MTDMESKNNSKERCCIQPTNRVKQIFLQSLLTILSLNIYAAEAATIQQNHTTSENTTNLFPIPIKSASLFMSLAINNTPTIVTERVLASSVSSAERRQHVAWFAESHTEWGFKYNYGNASLDDGFDCSGFVRYVLNYFDIKTSRSSTEQFKEGIRIPVESARAGDLVFFGSKNNVSHVAMVVSNDEKGLVVVHSTNTRGVVKENITESSYWRPKLKDKAVNIIGL
ncbi:MAG: C40 family peptidase [Saprospiraceae bacterium]|nr:C40 family peptidase [Saprospiraceae bacterium]